MKKEYVVVGINATQDGGPYVLVTMCEARSPKVEEQKDLYPRRFLRHNYDEEYSSVRIDLKEYGRLKLKVGDVIAMELTKMKESEELFKGQSLVPGRRRIPAFY